jgi:hypothetical protein
MGYTVSIKPDKSISLVYSPSKTNKFLLPKTYFLENKLQADNSNLLPNLEMQKS